MKRSNLLKSVLFCKKTLIIGILLLNTGVVEVFPTNQLDSLLILLPSAKKDTATANLYMRIGQEYDYAGQKEKAREYYLKLYSLSKELNFHSGLFRFASRYTDMLIKDGKYDSIVVLCTQTREMAQQLNDKRQAAIATINIGNGYNLKGFYTTALNYYFEALSYYEAQGDSLTIGHIYDMIQTVYWDMSRFEEAAVYGEKAVALLRHDKEDPYLYSIALLNLANTYADMYPPQYEKAESCLSKAIRIAQEEGYAYIEATACLNYCETYRQVGKSGFEAYARRALEMFLELDDPESVAWAKINMGYVAFYKTDYEEAEKLIRQGMELAVSRDFKQIIYEAYRQLSDLSYARRNYREGLSYEHKADSVHSLIVNKEVLRSVEEIKIKYETEKKALKIAALEKENKLYFYTGILGIAILLLLLGILFYHHRLNLQKRRTAELQIKQLEQEKQLIATQSVLDGEVAERTRMARDLHDGLGGMLSAVKLNLKNMKTGIILENAEVERFDKALSMLDGAIGELRRVAHNMMPDSLARFGLKDALSDFCDSIPTVKFNYFGDGTRLNPKMEAMLYRIIHELVNNALKHAEASHILVQVVQEPCRIAIAVQDNGKGFDTSVESKGNGMKNICSRVASYNGSVDVYSAIGEGTEVNVEFQLTE
ncbi:MAG: histidine kinase [Prevotella sp.]|jgi:signal transduction histidine kinase|nr:histidine kinase [Prevotella sp.]